MIASADNIKRLEDLQNKLLLYSRVKGEYPTLISNGIYILTDWKIKEEKPWFGQAYSKITEFIVVEEEHTNSKYVGIFDKYLDIVLARMEKDRINFIKVRDELLKFGFDIIKKEKQQITCCNYCKLSKPDVMLRFERGDTENLWCDECYNTQILMS